MSQVGEFNEIQKKFLKFTRLANTRDVTAPDFGQDSKCAKSLRDYYAVLKK